MQNFNDADCIDLAYHTLFDSGNDEIAARMLSAFENMRLEVMSHFSSKPTVSDAVDILKTHSTPLLDSIISVIDSALTDKILEEFPSLERSAAQTASEALHRKKLPLEGFQTARKQIVDDANDEAILNLLEFQ